MNRRWLITGAGGMVATDLQHELEARDEDIVAASKSDLDITNAADVIDFIRDVKPAIIVNCAAFTKVDEAETNESVATAINGSAVEFLANGANRIGALLVHLSTDFVFDGAKQTPYEINDRTAPLSAYGRSKLVGERAAVQAKRHLIIRSSWLFGIHGPHFVET